MGGVTECTYAYTAPDLTQQCGKDSNKVWKVQIVDANTIAQVMLVGCSFRSIPVPCCALRALVALTACHIMQPMPVRTLSAVFF
jgi:hypothetical protein